MLPTCHMENECVGDEQLTVETFGMMLSLIYHCNFLCTYTLSPTIAPTTAFVKDGVGPRDGGGQPGERIVIWGKPGPAHTG